MTSEDNSIRTTIVGVGNCASALVQGVKFYKDVPDHAHVPGVMRPKVGRYHIRDIEFVAAFDVAESKVGLDLGEAIKAPPNCTPVFCDPGKLGVGVYMNHVMDGFGKYLRESVPVSMETPWAMAEVLKATGTDVVVNFLPVGSQKASEYVAESALAAGCALVNCIPVFLASEEAWAERFRKAGLPIIGDDIKSQVGATILHRALAWLFTHRGVWLDHTYQLNFGGNTDFLNMLERERLESKKLSKTRAVNSQLPQHLAPEDIHVGPSDFVPWLHDRKWAYIRMEGRAFGEQPLTVEAKLEVVDSPNSAGVVIDAVRCAKLALDRGWSGPQEVPSAYFMKSPPEQMEDDQAFSLLEVWIG